MELLVLSPQKRFMGNIVDIAERVPISKRSERVEDDSVRFTANA